MKKMTTHLQFCYTGLKKWISTNSAKIFDIGKFGHLEAENNQKMIRRTW